MNICGQVKDDKTRFFYCRLHYCSVFLSSNSKYIIKSIFTNVIQSFFFCYGGRRRFCCYFGYFQKLIQFQQCVQWMNSVKTSLTFACTFFSFEFFCINRYLLNDAWYKRQIEEWKTHSHTSMMNNLEEIELLGLLRT